MSKFKQKLIRFLSGRYGMDQLYYFLSGAALVVMIVYLFVQKWWLYPVILGLLVWASVRCFSRNIAKRRKENQAFLKFFRSIGGFFKLNWNRIRFLKSKVFKKCPHCKAVLRLPRSKGKHSVRCPRCGRPFEVKVCWGKKR
ncbi:MAG: hypothetical protein IKZ19_04700 [Clostridia bacterium]|nr:hypothetical protein [Clostridia bacterium]